MANVKFVKNDLGNIDLKYSNDEELEGFIRHTEYLLTDIYNFTLRLDEEEFNNTKRVFVYLRTKKKFKKHLDELTKFFKEAFKDAEIITSGKKTRMKYHLIDMFLYE